MSQTRPQNFVPPFRAGERKRVLVVDDDEMLAQTLAGFLSRFHQVKACSTGEEALSHFSAGEDWDVILCDFHMPDWSGIDLWQEASRKRPELAKRFVFMTGNDVDDPACGLQDIPNSRLTKPIDIKRLLEMIASS